MRLCVCVCVQFQDTTCAVSRISAASFRTRFNAESNLLRDAECSGSLHETLGSMSIEHQEKSFYANRCVVSSPSAKKADLPDNGLRTSFVFFVDFFSFRIQNTRAPCAKKLICGTLQSEPLNVSFFVQISINKGNLYQYFDISAALSPIEEKQ